MASSARIDELRKKFDENPRRYFAPLANEYRKAGDLEQAIFICQEYLPQQPGHMSGHIVYGQALFEVGRHDEARGVFETALALDPENLIALHHLGDIARLAGNATDARTWYERVLEADPRNEEVTALLSSLTDDRTSQLDYIVPAGAVSDDSDPFVASESEPSLAVEHDVPFGNVDLQATHAESEEIDRDRDPMETAGTIAEERPLEVSAASAASPFDHAPEAAPNSELLDLDDFSLGGVAFETPASATPAAMDEATSVSESAAISELPARGASHAESAGDDFDLSREDTAFEADTFATAGTAPAPPIELATDLNLGLPDDGMAMTSEAIPLSDLETFEAGVLGTAIPDVAPLETETFFEISPVETPAFQTADSAPIDGGHDGLEVPGSLEVPASLMESTVPESMAAEPLVVDPTVDEVTSTNDAAPPEAFVTETMAELYIQQGHLDSALGIYRKLREQRPNDPEIGERLRAIEDHMFRRGGAEPAPAPASGETFEYSRSTNEPTIREFLGALLARRAARVSPNSSNGAASAASPATAEPTLEQRSTASASETISGSIDALFSGAESSASDTSAASTLADAFALESSESSPLQGAPAHRATDELSLDHVFKPNTPPRPSAEHDAFSFDQFFADELSESAPNASGDKSAGAPNATDDIAQFNAWLNGLKKT